MVLLESYRRPGEKTLDNLLYTVIFIFKSKTKCVYKTDWETMAIYFVALPFLSC